MEQNLETEPDQKAKRHIVSSPGTMDDFNDREGETSPYVNGSFSGNNFYSRQMPAQPQVISNHGYNLFVPPALKLNQP